MSNDNVRKPSEVFFPFRFKYQLSEAGLRASLLTGGDGKRYQEVEGRISLADADALGIGLNGNGGLDKGYLEILSADLRYPSSATFSGLSSQSFIPAVYDQPRRFDDLLIEAVELRGKRLAVVEALKEEREEIRRAVLSGSIEHNGMRVRVGEKVFDFDNDPEVRALYEERKRIRLEEEEKARAERLAEDELRRAAKREQIAAWISNQGTESQKERYAAGLFPEEEAIKAMEEEAFAVISNQFEPYMRITESDVRATCSIECGCHSGYANCSISCESEILESVTDDEWRQIKLISRLKPDAALVALKLHVCNCDDSECDSEEGFVQRKSLYVKLQVGAFIFNRDYAVE